MKDVPFFYNLFLLLFLLFLFLLPLFWLSFGLRCLGQFVVIIVADMWQCLFGFFTALFGLVCIRLLPFAATGSAGRGNGGRLLGGGGSGGAGHGCGGGYRWEVWEMICDNV